jgi:hypothetical protein
METSKTLSMITTLRKQQVKSSKWTAEAEAQQIKWLFRELDRKTKRMKVKRPIKRQRKIPVGDVSTTASRRE